MKSHLSKSRIIILFSILAILSLTSSKNLITVESINYYRNEYSKIKSNYQYNVTTPGLWNGFVIRINSLVDEIDNELSQGELSSVDLTELRDTKSKLILFKEFGEGISPDGNMNLFNGRMLRQIRTIFPEITWQYQQTYLVDIKLYKLTFGTYVCYSARHDKKAQVLKITYSTSNTGKCSSIGGNFNVIGGVYKTFWDNSSCTSVTSPTIKITQSEFVMTTNEAYYFVKPFEE